MSTGTGPLPRSGLAAASTVTAGIPSVIYAYCCNPAKSRQLRPDVECRSSSSPLPVVVCAVTPDMTRAETFSAVSTPSALGANLRQDSPRPAACRHARMSPNSLDREPPYIVLCRGTDATCFADPLLVCLHGSPLPSESGKEKDCCALRRLLISCWKLVQNLLRRCPTSIDWVYRNIPIVNSHLMIYRRVASSSTARATRSQKVLNSYMFRVSYHKRLRLEHLHHTTRGSWRFRGFYECC